MDDRVANFVSRVPASQSRSFSVESIHSGGNVRVTIVGKLDEHAAPVIEEVIAVVAHRPTTKTVDVDVSGVRFIDQAGVRSLIRARREAAASARAFRLLVAESGTVRQILLNRSQLVDSLA